MKVIIINRSDSRGGAAVVSERLMEALRQRGVEADMLVLEKRLPSRFVHRVVGRWRARIPFLLERLQIFLGNGRNRADLFKADTASFGVPLHHDPLVTEADVVCLAWINQGMLSLGEIKRIMALGKPVVWIMHDMWCFTGICHHAGECEGYMHECGMCPLLGRKASLRDISAGTLRRKKRLYSKGGITFVAVSNWLRERARGSSLLREARVEVIGNPVPTCVSLAPLSDKRDHGGSLTVLIAAARLDDPVKGLPILIDTAARLRLDYPELAERLKFVAVGALKNPDALKDFPLPLVATGPLDSHELSQLYRRAAIVISTSLYETLPGTLVEGQLHGALPVAFDRGGQSDIITDGLTGVLVPFGDDPAACMAAGLQRGVEMIDSVPATELQERLAREALTRFSRTAVADRYINLFNDLLKK